MGKPEFAVAEQRQAGWSVVVVRGDLDSDTAPAVLAAVDLALAASPTSLVLDCIAVTFFGSSGIRTLLEVRDACHAIHVPFRLVADTRRVLRPLEVTGLLGEFVILRDVPTAC